MVKSSIYQVFKLNGVVRKKKCN